MAKIALIGAGSVVFTRRLLQDVVTTPALQDAEIALMDIDTDRLDLIGKFGARLVSDAGSGNKITATADRRAALEGADYVITTIRVGDDLQIDQGIPMERGVNQSVADTIGPGGVFKAFPTSELNKWKAAAPDLLTAWEKDINKKRGDTMASKVAKRWRELTK